MGTLHIVATPIGNLEDVTLRSLRVLREADWVLAEDTRRTRILLDHFEIPQKPSSLHAHNEAGRIERVIEALDEGRSVALVSDAGTPLISDPGARLVAAVAASEHRIDAVPGASALLAALTVSGLKTDRVLFLGFLPRKAGARRRLLESQRDRPDTIVLFESPRRVGVTLKEIAEIFGPDRPACLARELTKRHEEVLRDSVSALAAQFSELAPRGECTLVIAGASEKDGGRASVWSDAELDGAIRSALLEGTTTRDLARALSGPSGWARREIYARALLARDRTLADGEANPVETTREASLSTKDRGDAE